MKLSILISVYNAEKYIGRCIQSLLDQGMSPLDYEIIIRDDGSADNTVALIKDLAQNYSNIALYEDTNRGAYAQRNILLNQAQGDYIYFVDADDYLAKNTLSKVLDYSLENDLDLAGFGTKVVHGFNKDVVENKTFTKNPSIISGPEFLADNPDIRHEIWWYIIKNDFIKRSKIIFEESRYHNDVMFTLKLLLEVNRMAYFPEECYYYYQSPNSIMRSTEKSHNEKLVKAGKSLIGSLADLTSRLERNTNIYPKNLVNVFKYRRDKYAFYLLLKMIKSDYSNTQEIISFTRFLKDLEIYPLKHYNKDIRSKSKFFFIKTLVNNRNLIRVHGKFKKYI